MNATGYRTSKWALLAAAGLAVAISATQASAGHPFSRGGSRGFYRGGSCGVGERIIVIRPSASRGHYDYGWARGRRWSEPVIIYGGSGHGFRSSRRHYRTRRHRHDYDRGRRGRRRHNRRRGGLRFGGGFHGRGLDINFGFGF